MQAFTLASCLLLLVPPCIASPGVSRQDLKAWRQTKAAWSTKQEEIRRLWETPDRFSPGRVHEYWKDHAQDWGSDWDELKGDAKRIWTDQIDPRETYTEEVWGALHDPETARGVVEALLSTNGKRLLAEKMRFLPVYDPYEGKLRTLDGAARDFVDSHGGTFEGSAFAADPVGTTTLTLMLDRKALWNKRILRTKNGDWTSVREAIEMGGSMGEIGTRMSDLHRGALAAFQAGHKGKSMSMLGQFADLAQSSNHRSLGDQASQPGSKSASGVFDALSAAQDASKASAPLESKPIDLLRKAENHRRLGKTHRALQSLRALVEGYPHSGFADDALYGLARADFDSLNVGRCTDQLNVLLERYPTSARCDDALYLLGNCYESLVMPTTDKQREAAVRNYKEILRKYEDESVDWEAEIIELVLYKRQAVDCYTLLLEAFGDSAYRERAKHKLIELEGN